MRTRPEVASYIRTRNRFDKPRAANKYATRHGGHKRDLREQQCILSALAHLPAGSRVLDLPSGTGRLAPVLVERGFQVVGADSSAHMVEVASRQWQACTESTPELRGKCEFEVQDIMQTHYADEQFDAVICNRLFHHFTEADTRIKALAELRRITAGPVVVSFFRSLSLGALIMHMRCWLRGTLRRYRIPISLREFTANARAAGLVRHQVFPTLWGISPQTYVVFLPGYSRKTR